MIETFVKPKAVPWGEEALLSAHVCEFLHPASLE